MGIVIGCEDHVIRVENPQHRFDECSEQRLSRAHGKQKALWNRVDPKTRSQSPGNLDRHRIGGAGKGLGIEVEGEPVDETVEGLQQMPLVPADPRFLFEEGEDVDRNRCDVLTSGDACMESTPPAAQRSSEISEKLREKAYRGHDSCHHDRGSYMTAFLERESVERVG
jgi:hypothetical protein